MNILNYLIPPILGGIIALSTNWLAIKMLFRPHRAKYIFGMRIPFTPGLVPKERARITQKMAEAISTRLLTPDVLAAELSDPALWPLPDITIGEALDSFGIPQDAAPIANRLKVIADMLLPKALQKLDSFEESMPQLDAKLGELTYKVLDENLSVLASIFVSKDKIYTSIKKNILGYLSDEQNYEMIREKLHAAIDALLTSAEAKEVIQEKLLDINIRDGLRPLFNRHMATRVLTMAASYIAKHMPIQSMIENKLNSFDVAEAEELIISVAGRELRLIILLGGVLGFIIGGLTLIL